MNFKQVMLNYKPKVEAEIEKKLKEKVKRSESLKELHQFYYGVLLDFISRGGKRLRPVCFLMAADGANVDEKSLIKASCSIEFLHNSTLIHDDIMDMDELRRGGPTAHIIFRNWHKKNFGFSDQKFGESIAILLGNTAYTLSEEMLLESDLPKDKKAVVLTQLSKYFQLVCEGQLYDILLEKRGGVTEKEYLEMVNMKTGALFVAPLMMGASLADHSENSLSTLKKYGTLMGQAFQIEDDVIGTFGDEKKSGKPTDSDIKEGKKTLLVIKALENGDENQKTTLLSVLGNREATSAEIDAVRKIIKDTGSFDYSVKLAKSLAEDAKKSLDSTELKEESKKFFRELADFVIDREV